MKLDNDPQTLANIHNCRLKDRHERLGGGHQGDATLSFFRPSHLQRRDTSCGSGSAIVCVATVA